MRLKQLTDINKFTGGTIYCHPYVAGQIRKLVNQINNIDIHRPYAIQIIEDASLDPESWTGNWKFTNKNSDNKYFTWADEKDIENPELAKLYEYMGVIEKEMVVCFYVVNMNHIIFNPYELKLFSKPTYFIKTSV